MLDFAYEPASKKKCGCYAVGLPDAPYQKSVLVPLRSCQFYFEVVNAMVNVTLLQTYQNPTDKFLQVEYSFPVSPNSCVYRFVAQFGGHRMEGVVKQKEEAKLEYQSALKGGKKAAYGEQNEKDRDMLTLKVGNIGPKQQVTIQIQYLHELYLSFNTFYQLKVPAFVSPCFLRNIPVEQLFSGYIPYGAPKIEGNFYWSFKISLRTTRKVTFFDSSSHKLTLIKQNDTCTESLLSSPKAFLLNEDFVFSYTTEGYELPSCVFGRSDKSSTAMLSFIPKFCSLSISDAYKASIEGKKLQSDMESAKGEYVFLLDRSGSMGGKRIEKAKEALVLFIKSLPKDTYFNVVSFGSNSQKLFPSSQRYDNNSIEIGVAKVRQMSADLGGTQIYSPLNNLLIQKPIEGYPRHIFLLTDGEVEDTNKILKMISTNNKYARVHSIGIGSDASEQLIQGSARNGKGQYVFIEDNEEPSQKIIQLLADSLSPLISSVHLDFDESLIESIVPNPKSLPYFLKGQLVNFYVTFKGQLAKKAHFTFTYEDSKNKLPYSVDIMVDPESSSEPFIDRMGHFKSIRILEETLANNDYIEEYIYFVKKVNEKEQIIRRSVEHQVLSQFSAFVCVQKQLVDGKLQEINDTGKVKVYIKKPIPYIPVNDYANFDCEFTSCAIQSSAPQYDQNDSNSKWACFSFDDFQYQASSQPINIESIFDPNNQNARRQMLKSFQTSGGTILSQNFEETECFGDVDGDMKGNQQKPSGVANSVNDFFKNLIINKSEPEVQQREKQKQDLLKNNEVKKKEKVEKDTKDTMKRLVDEQDSDGFWKNLSLIDQLFEPAVRELVSNQQNSLAAAAYLLAMWIQKNHPQKQYSLIVKKALSFASKDAEQFKKFSQLFDQYIQ